MFLECLNIFWYISWTCPGNSKRFSWTNPEWFRKHIQICFQIVFRKFPNISGTNPENARKCSGENPKTKSRAFPENDVHDMSNINHTCTNLMSDKVFTVQKHIHVCFCDCHNRACTASCQRYIINEWQNVSARHRFKVAVANPIRISRTRINEWQNVYIS